jgi:hypothetical protein
VAEAVEAAGTDARRRCAKCGAEKGLGEFYRNPAGFDGRQRYCKACQKSLSQERYRGLRAKVLRAYGGDSPKCACCPEADDRFLCVDHIGNDGRAHRKRIGPAANQLYAWLVKHAFPPGFQLLCYNCNMGKAHFGQCPHRLGT